MVTDESGWSDAVRWEHLGGIRALLDAGADPEARVKGYHRPLHPAAEQGSPEVVAELAGRVAGIDAEHEGADLHPGGDPYREATSREIFAGYLARGDAVAFCCAYAGLRPAEARPVEGPPDTWLRLPERGWWS